jgi:hypothetical protein
MTMTGQLGTAASRPGLIVLGAAPTQVTVNANPPRPVAAHLTPKSR